MTWRPSGTLESSQARANSLRLARKFFEVRNVLEVETPIIAGYATMDVNIESVSANLAGQARFLHSSPEYFMKRLLAAGYPDIFQICHVFRNGEAGQFHLPEFSMVEWYRHGFGLPAIIQDAAEFIYTLLEDKVIGTDPVSISYQHAFENTLGFNPHNATAGDISRALEADDDLIGTLGNDRDAWLDLAMATCVAPKFDRSKLTAVHHYPISQASLARACPDNKQLADRFEIYFGEIELANGFVELQDAVTQHERFASDQNLRRKKKLPVHEIDAGLISALREGLPQCAGVAIGLDRLLMLKLNANHINDVTTFVPGI